MFPLQCTSCRVEGADDRSHRIRIGSRATLEKSIVGANRMRRLGKHGNTFGGGHEYQFPQLVKRRILKIRPTPRPGLVIRPPSETSSAFERIGRPAESRPFAQFS